MLEVFETRKRYVDRGAFSLAIPGGSVESAERIVNQRTKVWMNSVFFVNERPEEQKCYNLARTTWVDEFINQGKFKLENLHKVMENAEDLTQVAKDYEEQMFALAEDEVLPRDEYTKAPVFDLILLGMGADGHVGSIYHNSPQAKDENISTNVFAVDMPGKRTISMSLHLINQADRVVVAATGAGKAETVKKALEEDLEFGELPGAMVDAFSTIWFLDLAAASKLSSVQDDGRKRSLVFCRYQGVRLLISFIYQYIITLLYYVPVLLLNLQQSFAFLLLYALFKIDHQSTALYYRTHHRDNSFSQLSDAPSKSVIRLVMYPALSIYIH